MVPRVRSRAVEEAAGEWRGGMGLGFGARGEMVWLENGDEGGDGDSLRFYAVSTIPQMPLSEINGVVNHGGQKRDI